MRRSSPCEGYTAIAIVCRRIGHCFCSHGVPARSGSKFSNIIKYLLPIMFLVRNGGRVAARTCNAAVLSSSVQQVAFQRQQKQMSFFNLRRVGGGAAALLAIGAGAGAVAESAPKESVKAVKFSTQATAETALEARYDMYVQ